MQLILLQTEYTAFVVYLARAVACVGCRGQAIGARAAVRNDSSGPVRPPASDETVVAPESEACGHVDNRSGETITYTPEGLAERLHLTI